MRLASIVIGEDWETQVARYCRGLDYGPNNPMEFLGENLPDSKVESGFAAAWSHIFDLDRYALLAALDGHRFPWVDDFRLGGAYRGSLVATPGSRFTISDPDRSDYRIYHIRACDHVRAGDVDWDELLRIRQEQGRIQYHFLQEMVRLYGIEAVRLGVKVTQQYLEKCLADEQVFLQNEFKPLICHSAIVDGEWYIGGNNSLFSTPDAPAANSNWNDRLIDMLRDLAGRTWLTVVECLVKITAEGNDS